MKCLYPIHKLITPLGQKSSRTKRNLYECSKICIIQIHLSVYIALLLPREPVKPPKLPEILQNPLRSLCNLFKPSETSFQGFLPVVPKQYFTSGCHSGITSATRPGILSTSLPWIPSGSLPGILSSSTQRVLFFRMSFRDSFRKSP